MTGECQVHGDPQVLDAHPKAASASGLVIERVVRLWGELDLSSRDDIRRRLADAITAANRVVVDLAAVEFIDCAAIGAIVSAYAVAELSGVEMVLRSPQPSVRRVLALVELDRLVPVVP
ncbi:MAG: anti-sigma factor antagonist [Actinomycetia bacterium]|nr:anti-sigma factor antagonist [Actinomycetes bacterium]